MNRAKAADQRPGGADPVQAETAAEATVAECHRDEQAPALRAAKGGPPRPSLAERLCRYPPPQEELDLHGLTAEEAEEALRRFVGRCRGINLATLRIITGKGLHSPGQPVLPAVAEATLAELQREQSILAFRWEQRRRGRESGALIVYLARNQGAR